MSSSQEHPCAFDRIRFAPLAASGPLDNDYRFNLGSRHLAKEAKWLRESEYAAASAGRGGGGNPRLGEAEPSGGGGCQRTSSGALGGLQLGRHTSSNGIIVQLDPRSSSTAAAAAAAAALNRILSAPLLCWVVAWSPLPLHWSLQRAPASGCLRPALPAAFVPGPPPTSSRPISFSSFIITSTGPYHQITSPPRHHLRARHRNRAAQSSFASARQCRANTSPPKPTRSKRIDSLSTNPAPLHLLSPRPLHSTPTASSRSPHPTIIIS
ncbi:hypothetical protein PANT_9c00228 [Moesziomyces antarcticus T-34]|uniref:Uncharacterized protein n=1 Tax=Pseudozyma antarctica (strain T-34) TaxID=1151754 RepID=M9MEP8_PSEA3|nr:hypothetical protein PANT_9c00228 [Moesziomyces antarcticus T-34]